MKFENTQVFNFEGALRGMRNPLESWAKNDTVEENGNVTIGENDLGLAKRLIRAGSEHRKFMRQIFVSVDITAPTYWIAEFDTYKIGVTRDSCSFQHKGTSKPFSIRDFCVDDNRMYDVLDPVKIKREHPLTYLYESDEYKLYNAGDRQYKVYKNGKIVSMPFSYIDSMNRYREFKERELTPTQAPEGYWYVNLGGRKNHERWLIHRLVGEVWIGKESDDLEINHKDGNKGNNCVENLEWVTHQENETHKHQNNLDGTTIHTRYERFKMSSKVTPHQRIQIKKQYSNGIKEKDIAKEFGLSQGQVWAILNNHYTTEDYELFETCWYWERTLGVLNRLRDLYNETKDYTYFRTLRQMLPMSYEYKFTVTMSYENVLNMVHQRKHHKLTEWSVSFIEWARTLPYAQDLIFIDETEE